MWDMSTAPVLSTLMGVIFMPAIWALAGLVPWADTGIRQTWQPKERCFKAPKINVLLLSSGKSLSRPHEKSNKRGRKRGVVRVSFTWKYEGTKKSLSRLYEKSSKCGRKRGVVRVLFTWKYEGTGFRKKVCCHFWQNTPHLVWLHTDQWYRRYRTDKHSIKIWTSALTLTLNTAIQHFHETLQLRMMCHQIEFDSKRISSSDGMKKQ